MARKGFEKKLDEINSIIETLEKDDIDLKDAVKSYKKGMELIKDCETDINKAKQELEIVNSEVW